MKLTSDLAGLIQKVREHYVEQFRLFTAAQNSELKNPAVSGEMKFQVGDEAGVFRNIAVVDYCAIEGEGLHARELQPDFELTFKPFSCSVGEALLDVSWIRWDNVNIEIDCDPPLDALNLWFDTWFDPEELHYDPGAEFSNCIHRVVVVGRELAVDFGTAPAEAFSDLVGLLVVDGGAKQIRICQLTE